VLATASGLPDERVPHRLDDSDQDRATKRHQRCDRSAVRLPRVCTVATAMPFLRWLGRLDQRRSRAEIRGMQKMLGVRSHRIDRYTSGRALEQMRGDATLNDRQRLYPEDSNRDVADGTAQCWAVAATENDRLVGMILRTRYCHAPCGRPSPPRDIITAEVRYCASRTRTSAKSPQHSPYPSAALRCSRQAPGRNHCA
jgi:hypothetical protein